MLRSPGPPTLHAEKTRAGQCKRAKARQAKREAVCDWLNRGEIEGSTRQAWCGKHHEGKTALGTSTMTAVPPSHLLTVSIVIDLLGNWVPACCRRQACPDSILPVAGVSTTPTSITRLSTPWPPVEPYLPGLYTLTFLSSSLLSCFFLPPSLNLHTRLFFLLVPLRRHHLLPHD